MLFFGERRSGLGPGTRSVWKSSQAAVAGPRPGVFSAPQSPGFDKAAAGAGPSARLGLARSPAHARSGPREGGPSADASARPQPFSPPPTSSASFPSPSSPLSPSVQPQSGARSPTLPRGEEHPHWSKPRRRPAPPAPANRRTAAGVAALPSPPPPPPASHLGPLTLAAPSALGRRRGREAHRGTRRGEGTGPPSAPRGPRAVLGAEAKQGGLGRPPEARLSRVAVAVDAAADVPFPSPARGGSGTLGLGVGSDPQARERRTGALCDRGPSSAPPPRRLRFPRRRNHLFPGLQIGALEGSGMDSGGPPVLKTVEGRTRVKVPSRLALVRCDE